MMKSKKIMTEYEEIYDNEKIESDKIKSMKELSKYTKILNKQDNLFIILKNFECIKLYDSKSLYKISMLLDKLPEENVSFTFYADEEEDEEEASIEKSSKRLRNQKRFSLAQNKLQPPLEQLEQKDNEKKGKEKLKDIKEEQKNLENIYLLDNIKDSFAQEIYKNGNIIGYDHALFKKIWKNLYILTLAISSIDIPGVGYYLYQNFQNQNYLGLGANGLSCLALFLLFITSILGNNKMKSKKKVNFRRENGFLMTFIFMAISCIGYFGYFFYNNNMGLPTYVVLCEIGVLLLLVPICIVIIYLNNKIIAFYKEYHKMAEEGTLLVEVE